MLTWSNTVATINGFRLINSLASFNNLVNGDRQVASCVSVAFNLMVMNGEAGVSIVHESNLL
jgi:hypothetical protein